MAVHTSYVNLDGLGKVQLSKFEKNLHIDGVRSKLCISTSKVQSLLTIIEENDDDENDKRLEARDGRYSGLI